MAGQRLQLIEARFVKRWADLPAVIMMHGTGGIKPRLLRPGVRARVDGIVGSPRVGLVAVD